MFMQISRFSFRVEKVYQLGFYEMVIFQWHRRTFIMVLLAQLIAAVSLQLYTEQSTRLSRRQILTWLK